MQLKMTLNSRHTYLHLPNARLQARSSTDRQLRSVLFLLSPSLLSSFLSLLMYMSVLPAHKSVHLAPTWNWNYRWLYYCVQRFCVGAGNGTQESSLQTLALGVLCFQGKSPVRESWAPSCLPHPLILNSHSVQIDASNCSFDGMQGRLQLGGTAAACPFPACPRE